MPFASRYIALALAAALFLNPLARAEGAAPPAEAKPKEWAVLPLLPAETVAAVSVKDVTSAKERLKETGLWKILDRPELKEMIKVPLRQARGGLAMAEGATGQSLDDLLNSLQGEVTIAFMGMLDLFGEDGRPLPDVLFAIQPRENGKLWMAAIDKAVDKLNTQTQNTLIIEERVVGKASVVTLSHPQADIQINYCMTDGVFLLALGPGRVEKVLAARGAAEAGNQEELAKTLKAAPAFQHTLDKAGGSYDAMAYLNLEALRNLPKTPFKPKNDAEQRGWDAVGLNGIQAVSYTIGIQGKGLRETIFLDCPAEKQSGIWALFGGAAGGADAAKALAREPGNAVVAGALAVEPERLLAAFTALAQVDNPNAKADIDAALAKAGQDLGISVREDLFQAFSGEVTFSLAMPAAHPKLPVGFPRPVLKLGLRDAAVARKVLSALTQAAFKNWDVRQTMAGDRPIMVAREKQAFGKDPGCLSWSLGEKELIVSIFPLAVRGEVERLASESAPSLESDTDFDAGRQKLAGRYQALAYVDAGAIATAAYDILIPLAQLKGAGGPNIDPNVLPTSGVLARNLGGTLFGISGGKDGLAISAYSSTGLFATLGPGLAALGQYMKRHGGRAVAQDPELPAERESYRTKLGELGQRLRAFAWDHAGAIPNNLDELTPDHISAEERKDLGNVKYRGNQGAPNKIVAYYDLGADVRGPIPVLLQSGDVRVIHPGQLASLLEKGFTGDPAKPWEVQAVKPPSLPPDF
ncbi:MAG: DUF3352 domain-containing protein [Planctomycetes bacterium]|nr:DUF3352 domain-containing protein [Planctomycetota bacterium]